MHRSRSEGAPWSGRAISSWMGVRAALLNALVSLMAGCGAGEASAPPVNPRISNQAADPDVPTLPYEVSCDGPEDELRVLGGICGTKTEVIDWTPTDAPTGMGMAIGPADGPYLMVFGRVEREVEPGDDVSAELGYSAYFVKRGPAGNSVATLEQWSKGEPITSGSLITYRARVGACSPGWMGEGTLLWRTTTFSLAWWSGLPC